MTKRRRRQTIPCLESMEDRMVPSAINFSPAFTSQVDKLGDKLRSAGTSVQNYLNSVVQHRPGHGPIASWTTPTSTTHAKNTGLFGISWLKL